ncbi:SDR family oxidoreductase [Massilia soli]|uniref:SDR family oxidoreductase n=1 Tax=Massilia soli TaxID=2792854 RepID=A0ABS7SRN3_9BURK|nr:SDR family oxidoreductase [Massilia soli]
MNLSGAKVLVTGGGRGIGRRLVEGFLADGALVGVFERDDDLCAELRAAFDGRVLAWPCDVSDPDAVDAAVASAKQDGFEPDVLVNNAGVIHSEPLVNFTARGDRVHSRRAWRDVMAADLDSVFYVTSRVVDGMMARRCKGVVISISSIAAAGNPGQSAYSAAKAAVNALTATWAKELGPLGFRFAAIAPGFFDTPSTHAALSDTIITRLKQQIPLRRLGNPEAIYLAARQIVENDYLTGTVLELDGGLTL